MKEFAEKVDCLQGVKQHVSTPQVVGFRDQCHYNYHGGSHPPDIPMIGSHVGTVGLPLDLLHHLDRSCETNDEEVRFVYTMSHMVQLPGIANRTTDSNDEVEQYAYLLLAVKPNP